MLKRKNIVISLLLAAAMVTSASGCTKTAGGTTPSGTASTDTASTGTTTYPLKTNVTLTYWVPFTPIQGFGDIKSTNDTNFAKELIKETGVKIEFINPAGSDSAAFSAALNLLIASNDLPDIIENDWYAFPGGPEAPIAKGTTLKLNDLIDKNAPNLKAYLKANTDLDKDVKTDSGSYYCFPFLRQDKEQTVYHGPIVRQDLLDKLGLQIPTTIDEYENVLTKFKEAGIKAPLTFDWGSSGGSIGWDNAFVGAYGAQFGSFVEDGKIKYGPVQPGYKDFLSLMKKWYDNGLLDKNFATLTGIQKDTAMTSGTSAMTLGLAGSNIGTYTANANKAGNGFKFAGAPLPVLKKGDTAKFGQLDNRYTTYNAAAITTKCKNPDIAAKVLDYGYSPDGILLYNFGVKDVSYTIVNGKPTYTDAVMKDPQGRSFGNVNATFDRVGGAPTIQQLDYLYQNLSLPEQKAAIKTWEKTDAAKYAIPKISLTPAESSDAASILNSIKTYVNEMSYKFILGTEPISNFDKYVDQINKLGLDKYLKYNQDALDRYKKR